MFIKKIFNLILNKKNTAETIFIDGQEGLLQIYINSHLINLPAPYVNSVVINNLAVVLLDSDSSGSNIFAYDKNGLCVWRVQRHTFNLEKPGYQILEVDNEFLQAYCRDTWFKIDQKKGTLVSEWSDRGGLVILNKS